MGKTTVLSNTLPVPSTTQILQPVRKAGSQPIVILSLTGGCINNGLRLSSNILIACSLASSKSWARTSRSTDGAINRSYPSSAAALTIALLSPPSFKKLAAVIRFAKSVSTTKETFKNSSFSPRFKARTRWLFTSLTGSQ